MKQFLEIIGIVALLLLGVVAAFSQDTKMTGSTQILENVQVQGDLSIAGDIAVSGLLLNASSAVVSADTFDATKSGRFVAGVTTPLILMPGSSFIVQSSTQSTVFTVNQGGSISASKILLTSPSLYHDGNSFIRTNGYFTAAGYIGATTRDFSSLTTVKLVASSGHSGVITPAFGARELLIEGSGLYPVGQSFMTSGAQTADVYIIGSTPSQTFVWGMFWDQSNNSLLMSANNGAGSLKNIFFIDGDATNPAGLYNGVGNIIFDGYDTYPSFIEKDGKVWKDNIRMATDTTTVLQPRDIKQFDKPLLFEFDTTANHPRGELTGQIDFIMEALPSRLKVISPTDGTETGIKAYDAIKELIVNLQRDNILQDQRIKFLEEQLNITH